MFLGSLPPRTRVLVTIEHVLIIASVAIAMSMRFGVTGSWFDLGLIWRAALIAVVLQICLHLSDLYDLRHLSDRRGVVVGLIQALGFTSLVLGLLYYFLPTLMIGPGIFVLASVVVVGLVTSTRIGFNWVSHRIKPNERLLIVGASSAAIGLARELYLRRGELGVEIAGFLEADPDALSELPAHLPVLGTIADIPEMVRRNGIDRVVVSLADARGKLSMDQLLHMKLNDGVRFDHLASVYEQYTGKIAVENLRPSWLIFSEGFHRKPSLEFAKRVLDLFLSVTILLVMAPIMAIVALAVRFSSPGPVIYRQVRVGKDGVPFTVLKFRSMRADAEVGTGAVWSTSGDPRVTPVGRILRRTRLDELPQLWNVLRGEMSFVGPRPERPEFVSALTEQIPFYGQRHAVRPGLTGWAQVRHEYGSTVEDALQKLQYELFYIKHMSIAFDLFIVLETIKTVLVRRGS